MYVCVCVCLYCVRVPNLKTSLERNKNSPQHVLLMSQLNRWHSTEYVLNKISCVCLVSEVPDLDHPKIPKHTFSVQRHIFIFCSLPQTVVPMTTELLKFYENCKWTVEFGRCEYLTKILQRNIIKNHCIYINVIIMNVWR